MTVRGRGTHALGIRNSEAGRVVLPILVLLVALGGAGAWNYQRNLVAEDSDQKPRPFQSYASSDLEALRSAYSQEIAAYQKMYASQDAKRRRASDTGMIDERVEEFDRVRLASSRLRELSADVAEREARLREIELELRQRAGQLSGLSLHLRRLFTI
jgi:hypothetical protein